ncbi:type III polyketide synthase [Streptomyces sp. NPDC059009]|uniref:type III polyketide synthase n=1 Tax=Streptomyces sp. NPDC059009 TaxID=3346694 RepID=UPI0036CF36A6
MTRIASVYKVTAPHRHTQETLAARLKAALPDADPELLHRVHTSSGVHTRHLALPLDAYDALTGFGDANEAYLHSASDLGTEAIDGALRSAGVTPADVDMLMFVSTTGLATPSVDARLIPRLGLRDDIVRLPVFGLGCAAGAAGLARVDDMLRGRTDALAVLLSVELPTLTLQRDDPSPANLIGSALFGDGAAALALCGPRHPAAATAAGPTVVATRSLLIPSGERALGWDFTSTGFRAVLGPEIPGLVRTHLPDTVDAFLTDHHLTRGDIGAWICHPGGPKVLDAVETSLALPASALAPSRTSLAQVGNLSSASVLHILADVTAAGVEPDTWGLVLGFGPGFSVDLALLRWDSA